MTARQYCLRLDGLGSLLNFISSASVISSGTMLGDLGMFTLISDVE